MEFQNIWCEKSRVAVAKKACRGRCQLGVILSVTKDLKACTTDHSHGDLEILHSVQNDRV